MRTLSLLLVALLVFGGLGFVDQPALATSKPQGQGQEGPQVVKIKSQVQKRGTGKESRVRVTLRNGTMVKGYISKIEDSSFDVNASKPAETTSISYTDVQKLQGPGLSKGAKIGIVAAIAVAIVATVIAVGLKTSKVGPL